ncbi:Piso0_004411 [Millerozyma farinosa CBS 7064]|uniref:Meiotic nuclear division protein 1 n=1 Tax=Pichia sorbitophila (strain ATCC MYA-4447 / BCRC 22081 / CBS 7064 / NBRC 10061 / NRRL Y-12695) TaxID=559304 RepID=G8Y5E2_PICSO|nr:Piso0_004411 [Millerozyma farinosa CBS 7064]CCE84853.1 Piso0_004411 [Millerozyma farinosa CBS 7064]
MFCNSHAPKKGVSAEEKKERVLDFFTHVHSFYTLKELEKEAAKYAKISPMIVKEVVQQLIDDNLVNCEKCGTTNLYWSFKYERIRKQEQAYQRLEKQLADLQEKQVALTEKIQSAKLQRTAKSKFGQRSALLTELNSLVTQKSDFENLIDKYSNSNPDALQQAQKENHNLVRAIDLYTDSIESTIYYFTRVIAAPLSDEQLRAEFGIPQEFEDVSQLVTL